MVRTYSSVCCDVGDAGDAGGRSAGLALSVLAFRAGGCGGGVCAGAEVACPGHVFFCCFFRMWEGGMVSAELVVV